MPSKSLLRLPGATFGIVGSVCLFVESALGQPYIGADLYVLSAPGDPNINLGEFTATGDSRPALAAGGQVVGSIVVGPLVLLEDRALLWNSPGGVLTDMTPTHIPGFTSGVPFSTDGTRQVGWGGSQYLTNELIVHAMMWIGTAESAVDLHPTNIAGLPYSIAYGLGGTQQVGVGGDLIIMLGGIERALLWNGSPHTAVDLHPASGFEMGTIGLDTDGARQVGYGRGSATGGAVHALLWSGTAESVVDLNPTNLQITNGAAHGISGIQQVGVGSGVGTGGKAHAILWYGTPDSAVDLHPTLLPGFDNSRAIGTNGTSQVGWGLNTLTSEQRALLWNGTAESAVDLSQLLPFAPKASYAYTIDPDGTIWGTATDAAGQIHAVVWTPVPEPATWLMLILGGLLLIRSNPGFRDGRVRKG